MKIPAGTVTFVFTDIEGSTKHWEDHPKAMGAALEAHDLLIRHCIENHSGFVFKTVGDAFCAAFSAPREAIAAALEIQSTLASQKSKAGIDIQVRVAIHTGEAELRGRDYFGPTLSRLSRILSSGHGGQILVTSVTSELVRKDLPAGATLKDLGYHRFRDLFRSERIYQLLHPNLQSEFSPLRSLSDSRHNLPIQLTRLIGRESELAELHALLRSCRLLTLTGTGGCGKTRLAYHLAAEELDNFDEGVWLVELASVSDQALVSQAVGSVLGLRDDVTGNMRDLIIERIEAKAMLLILDNCEHLIEEVASLAADVLKACPELKILATSRESLRLPGECAWRTPSLATPDDKALSGAPETLLATLNECHGTRLLIERAMAAQPRFRVTSTNGKDIADICRRLDGIPLAIELAAARTTILTPAQISERLADRFKLLIGGDRTLSRRQQTLRATIDWSYLLLEREERTLLNRLSVFSGGWTLEAAECVCADEEEAAPSPGGESSDTISTPQSKIQSSSIRVPVGAKSKIGPEDILDLLGRLADKSLILADDTGDGFRYRMLQTIREYALENFARESDESDIRHRHVDYFLNLTEEAAPHIPGPDQADWVARLESEHDNIRAALEWCRRDADLAENALRMATAMGRFWHTRGYFTEGRRRLQEALVLGSSTSSELNVAHSRNVAGVLAIDQADFAAAKLNIESALVLWERLGNAANVAKALNNLGISAMELGEFEESQERHNKSLSIRESLGNELEVSMSLLNIGSLCFNRGDLEGAEANYNKSLEKRERAGVDLGIAECLRNLGEVYSARRLLPEARELFLKSLEKYKSAGDRSGCMYLLQALADVAYMEHRLDTSAALYRECLDEAIAMGQHVLASEVRLRLGDVARASGDLDTALQAYLDGLARAIKQNAHERESQSLNGLGLCLLALDRAESATVVLSMASQVQRKIKKAIHSIIDDEVTGARSGLQKHLSAVEFQKHWEKGSILRIDETEQWIRQALSTVT